MGGVDKGLQDFNGVPLAQHALLRLRPQVGPVGISANRNLDVYESFGVPVWRDGIDGYPGPLAGMLAALDHCETPWLVTAPCDSPDFPPDYVARLGRAALAQDADMAVVLAREEEAPAGSHDSDWRVQPVFCLLRARLRASLAAYLHGGGRKVQDWAASHHTVQVPFDGPGDRSAFTNANTAAQLQQLRRA